jgi:endonuclease/exonuclease/phosphatase family metal-dependent hydrolase
MAFKVMTWNVENLFRRDSESTPEELQEYQQKLTLLAGFINSQAPDVAAFQEVGGEEPLHDLQQALGGTYPHRAVSTFPDRRGIRVAFLSKVPVEETMDFVDFPPGPALDLKNLTGSGESEPVTRMSRGALLIRVTKGNLTATLITAHLKSKLLSFPRAHGSSFQPRDENERTQVAGIALHRRAAEAATLRLHINAILQDNNHSPLVLLGDFNDVPEAQTSLLLTGPPGSEIDTRGFNRPDKGDDVRLFNLAPLIALERRFSRVHYGRGELLDQILVSEEFLPPGPDNHRQLPEVDSHVDFAEALRSVRDDPGERRRDVAPDHAPVSAQFDL